MTRVTHGERLVVLLILIFVGWSPGVLLAADQRAPKRDPVVAATDVAKTWIVALMSGKIDEVMSASALPFSWDRKMLVRTKEELRALYAKVVADKGARDLKPSKIAYADEAKTARLLESATFEKKPDVVAVMAWFGDEGIGILVTKGPNPKVRGFSD